MPLFYPSVRGPLAGKTPMKVTLQIPPALVPFIRRAARCDGNTVTALAADALASFVAANYESMDSRVRYHGPTGQEALCGALGVSVLSYRWQEALATELRIANRQRANPFDSRKHKKARAA